jgi:hypothetical protein
VLAVRVRFRRPLVEGVYACLHVYVDCDADETTGLAGADLWVRASFGSRYQRTSTAPPSPDAPAPASIRRASWSQPYTSSRAFAPVVAAQRGRAGGPADGGRRDAVRRAAHAARGPRARYNRFVRIRLQSRALGAPDHA